MISKAECRRVASLATKKGRAETGLFLVEGLRSVREAVHSSTLIESVFVTASFGSTQEGATLLEECRRRSPGMLHQATERELDTMADTVNAQGIVAVARKNDAPLDTLLTSKKSRLLIVALDAVADPGNVGGIIRTCDWFGVDGVVLGNGCVDLYNPKVVRATMGSIFHLPIVEDVNLAAAFARAKERAFIVAVTDMHGQDLASMREGLDRLFLVFGNEARGVSEPLRSVAGLSLAITRFGKAESLNVGVACGILLSALRP